MIDGRPHTHRCAESACDKAFSCKKAECQDALYKMCSDCKRQYLANESCSAPHLAVDDAGTR